MGQVYIFLPICTQVSNCDRKELISIKPPILLEEVRDEGDHKKLLFNVLVKEDSIIIATKVRGNKEETLVDIGSILKNHVEPREIEVLRETCNSIYNKIK